VDEVGSQVVLLIVDGYFLPDGIAPAVSGLLLGVVRVGVDEVCGLPPGGGPASGTDLQGALVFGSIT